MLHLNNTLNSVYCLIHKSVMVTCFDLLSSSHCLAQMNLCTATYYCDIYSLAVCPRTKNAMSILVSFQISIQLKLVLRLSPSSYAKGNAYVFLHSGNALRRKKRWCSSAAALHRLQKPAHAVVGKLGDGVVEEDVGRLEVVMDHVVLVEEDEGREHIWAAMRVRSNHGISSRWCSSSRLPAPGRNS
jgi:hypothetical protein